MNAAMWKAMIAPNAKRNAIHSWEGIGFTVVNVS